MSPLSFLLIFVLVLVAMEGVAWVVHRYVMHGLLWSVHKSHHEPRTGFFELNDIFSIAFAAVSIAFMYVGYRDIPAALPVGYGILAYGLVYFLFHDVLVHRRIKIGDKPRKGYLSRIVQAHQLHHAVAGQKGCVSFGFVFAPSPQRLKKLLQRAKAAQLRSPVQRQSTQDAPIRDSQGAAQKRRELSSSSA